MSPDEVLTLAKKRVKNSSTVIDWELLYRITIDDIFTRKQWKFAQGELNYMHFQSTFEKQFNSDATEKALTKIKSLRMTMNFAPGPIPLGNAGRELDFIPLQRFMTLYPDHVTDGSPFCYTELKEGDGTNGKQIGIYYRPNSDASIWINGDFAPTYTIDANPMPILPVQFHRLVLFGVVMHAADEAGQEKLSVRAERWYELGIDRMDTWDLKNGKYHIQRLSEEQSTRYDNGPVFPDNYPVGSGRRF